MKKVVAFDLDGTLAVTKSPITDKMSDLLGQLLTKYQVCVISGGNTPQFEKQLLANLKVDKQLLSNLHLMPTCGTKYLVYNQANDKWDTIYSEDLTDTEKTKIVAALEKGAKSVDLWEENPIGEIIEDRGSQITLSALGQDQTPEKKHDWDPDGKKKLLIRDATAKLIPEFEVRTGGTTSVDVTKPGIDKAYGMKKLMEALDVEMKDIFFVGDRLSEGGNDYPVKEMGIDSIAIESWEETAIVIETALVIKTLIAVA